MQTKDFTQTEKNYGKAHLQRTEQRERVLSTVNELGECPACEAEKEPAENPNVMKRDPRKNSMKNKPCPCSSGKKFKSCCWNKFSPKNLQKKVSEIVEERIDSE